MSTYNKRDLKAADLFATILFGFGFFLAMMAIFMTVDYRMAGRVDGKHVKVFNNLVLLWILAGVFLLCGTVLNLKIRQLARNKGRESKDPEGPQD